MSELEAKQSLIIDQLTIKLEAAEATIKELREEKESLEKAMNAPKPVKSLKELAKDALNVQNACNLSGVVHGFSRAMEALYITCPGLRSEDTEKRNRHPIAVLWASKVASLTGCEYGDTFSKAYEKVVEITEE